MLAPFALVLHLRVVLLRLCVLRRRHLSKLPLLALLPLHVLHHLLHVRLHISIALHWNSCHSFWHVVC